MSYKLAVYEMSLRELQTVSPLANHITKMTKKDFPIYHPYAAEQYDQVASELLNNPEYQGKTILLCWDHYNIPHVVKALRVTQKFTPTAENVFDTVYVMHYTQDGTVKKFTVLENQYPVDDPGSWADLCKCCRACSAPKKK